ncbi:type II toxin-antitoxin system RelE/ParE family toxin [Maricaulis maris]|uniref:type II toxin-antitoxin system RelE/ParE family toxin n=1 Tax=Maricaulis maris TaxID=74318 RepID=UPI003B8E871A
MGRDWRLTPLAEQSLREIARWTIETFGQNQAAAYMNDLIARCSELANGQAFEQNCSQLVDSAMPEDMCFSRCGQHFIVFVRDSDFVTIIEILHARSNLPARLSNLGEK